jgi:hypothetical protein
MAWEAWQIDASSDDLEHDAAPIHEGHEVDFVPFVIQSVLQACRQRLDLLAVLRIDPSPNLVLGMTLFRHSRF